LISNLAVQNFSSRIVAEASYISVLGASLNTITGIVLNTVSNSTFTGVSYIPVEVGYHAAVGPVLSVSGGGHNRFVFADSQSEVEETSAIMIMNSSYNIIEGANVSCFSEGEAARGILLTQDSSHNSVGSSDIFVLDDTRNFRY